ncbi:unnamed protein product [Allacma fusca]|uniref:Major facilitator superfamily associated domain-containing protein n=1 Tax=Allacma fusca TaxID=39272 RepID=A0A8J2K1D3_9HEXA|nr:unnamed protein product [Allacma fusca]
MKNNKSISVNEFPEGQDSVNKLDLTSQLNKDAREEEFWPRVWKDLCDKELLPLKILFFIKAGTVFVLYPYLNLHIKTLGLDAHEAGVSNALTILTIIGQPLAGMISDKIGNFKGFLAIITIITPIPALLMLAVPIARETIELPQNMTYLTDCEWKLHNFQTPTFTFRPLDGEDCTLKNSSQINELHSMPNIQCGYLCEENEIYTSLQQLPVEPGIKYSIPHSNKSFITFENMTQSLFCRRNSTNGDLDICEFLVEPTTNHSYLQFSSVDFSALSNDSTIDGRNLQIKISGITMGHHNVSKTCRRNDGTQLNNCESACLTIVPRIAFCSNTAYEKVYDEKLTFWTYNILRVILTLFSSTCWIMFEGAVLAIMKEKNGDYGIQRASSYIAAIIAAPASGYMISYFHDFRPAFYLYSVLQVLSGLLTLKIHLEFKKPAEQVFGSLLKLLGKVQVIGLLIAVLFSGIAWGFLESFLFWFLQNLGGDGLLMGLTITVGGIAGLPFLIINKPIIDKLGHVNVISIGLLFYGVRLVGYSFIHNPWWCLPYEALEAVTSSLAITAANTYGSVLACKDTVVSIQGIIGALYYSVGRSVGGLVGGYLIKFCGEKSAYQIMAAGTATAGLLYYLFNLVYNFCSKTSRAKMDAERGTQNRIIDKLGPLKFEGGYPQGNSISNEELLYTLNPKEVNYKSLYSQCIFLKEEEADFMLRIDGAITEEKIEKTYLAFIEHAKVRSGEICDLTKGLKCQNTLIEPKEDADMDKLLRGSEEQDPYAGGRPIRNLTGIMEAIETNKTVVVHSACRCNLLDAQLFGKKCLVRAGMPCKFDALFPQRQCVQNADCVGGISNLNKDFKGFNTWPSYYRLLKYTAINTCKCQHGFTTTSGRECLRANNYFRNLLNNLQLSRKLQGVLFWWVDVQESLGENLQSKFKVESAKALPLAIMDNENKGGQDSSSVVSAIPVTNGRSKDLDEDGKVKNFYVVDFIKEYEKEGNLLKMQSFARLEAQAEIEASARNNPPKKKGWDSFWKRTLADMTNKNLLPIKTLFFFKAATLFVLYPFLTLHIKSLGLDAAEAGINSAFIPVVAILGPPVAGIIADKIGNFKVLLAAMTLVTAGLALLLLLVPIARETVTLPLDITFAMGCGGRNSVQLEMVEHNLCTLDTSKSPWSHMHPSVVQCGTICPAAQLKKAQKYAPFSSLPLPENQTYLMPGKKLTFTPFTKQRPSLICSKGSNISCFFAFADLEDVSVSTNVKTAFSQLRLPGSRKSGSNVTELTLEVQGSWKFGNQEFDAVPMCAHNSDVAHENETKCLDKCLLNYERNLFCSNKEETIVHDVALTFWLYTLFRIILGLGSATSWIMFEGAVLAILKECGGDYGLQRVSALVAAVVVCPLSGALIYTFQDFRPAFYLYAVLQTFSAFLTLKIDLTFKTPAEKVLGHLKEVLSQVEILIFFFAMFLSGSAWGYLESFLFWFLKNLGGSEILMGLTVSVGGLFGLPLLIMSRIVIKKFGHVNVLCLGLFFYFIRLFGYSYIQNPWMCLPFEAMEAITSSLAITAAATYAAALSTEQTIASIQGFMGALYFGIGRGAGSLVGGFFIKWYGERITFQIFGVIALISSVLYFILNMAYIRRHTRVHYGLDINNLRGLKSEETLGVPPNAGIVSVVTSLDNSNHGNSTDAENPASVPKSEIDDTVLSSGDSGTQKLNGGYIGPCDVDTYTDIPLDEEESPDSTNNVRKRPASLPEKSQMSVEISTHRSAEN